MYQSSPDAAPDSEFEPGALGFLVAGNSGRMLDPRRTPVTIVEVRTETGFIVLRIAGFEDAGAIWEVPLEDVGHYQFARGSARASDEAVAEMRRAIERLDREWQIEADPADRGRTTERIAKLAVAADQWLGEHSRFVADGRLPDPIDRRGDVTLAAEFGDYMRQRELLDIEQGFARQFVSNPSSGEMVKGHRIVLAELGLVGYAGTVLRDPATFAGTWSRERRAAHICARLAFLRALFARMGITHLTLWRGLSADGPLRTNRRRTFISTSFAEAVARDHFDTARPTRALMCQSVPVERVFMTYLETSAMNDRFLEAEAVLLAQPDDSWP